MVVNFPVTVSCDCNAGADAYCGEREMLGLVEQAGNDNGNGKFFALVFTIQLFH